MLQNQEKFKTMIGGQALIEGIMMRGPKLDAIVVRNKEGVQIETKARRIRSKNSIFNLPVLRGAANFLDSQICGVKALMQSADLSPDEPEETPSKFDLWLEERLGEKKFKDFVVGTAVALGMGMMILLFFLLPNFISTLFEESRKWIRPRSSANFSRKSAMPSSFPEPRGIAEMSSKKRNSSTGLKPFIIYSM